MSESFDMSQPVTRGELREELAKTREEVDHKFDLLLGAMLQRLDERFDRFRSELRAEMRTEMRTEIRAAIEGNNVVLRAEIGRDLRAMEESLITRMSAMQEPYLDLPRRVARLEAKVFPPRPARGKRR